MKKWKELSFGCLTVISICAGALLGGVGGVLIAMAVMDEFLRRPVEVAVIWAFSALGGMLAGAGFGVWLIVKISNRK